MMPMPMMGPPIGGVMRPMGIATPVMATQQKQMKKLVPQDIPRDKNEEKPPVTTVFVGNISERAPDMMIKQMLQRCGNVLSWKRVQGASGKLQAFGFCEYENPEATLRCIRLLNEWKIADKNLVVKVDAKTKTLLDEYRKKKKAKEQSSAPPAVPADKDQDSDKEKEKDKDGDKDSTESKENGDKGDKSEKEEGEESASESVDELDENTKREDRVAQAGLEAIMREYAFELAKEPPASKQAVEKEQKTATKKKDDKEPRDVGFEDMDLEEDKRDIINREIKMFRDLHKSLGQIDCERRKEREIEEEEEAYERRKLEKKLREKEAAYQERLKNWEQRERKKSREYEKEKEREDERKAEEAREARRLKEFLEDYDDLRDDPKFYKGSPLARRLKEREKEKEADARDRQREKEELEELKRKLLDQGHPDPEAELARIEREREEHLRPRLQLIEAERAASEVSDRDTREVKQEDSEDEKPPKPKVAPPVQLRPVDSTPISDANTPFTDDDASRLSAPGQFMDEESSSQPGFGPAIKEEPVKLGFGTIKLGASNSPSATPPIGPTIGPAPPPASSVSMGTTIVMGGQGAKRKKLTVGDVFNQDDDEQAEGKRRKLIPLDYDEDKGGSGGDEKKPTTAEEKRQRIKGLIESIPTAKDELFNFPLDWSIVDQSLMDKRIKPWVTKKIVEYIGEEEPTLTDFICQKVVAHSSPQSIQNDVAMFERTLGRSAFDVLVEGNEPSPAEFIERFERTLGRSAVGVLRDTGGNELSPAEFIGPPPYLAH
nr:hypothetical protein BaRGS_023868 [Batillaria attramentaria]